MKHPEFLPLTRRRMVVANDDKIGSWSVVEPLLIVSLDYDQKKLRGNGGKKRRGS